MGAAAGEGIAAYPVREGREYPHPAPAADADGNDRAGVRLPDLAVPVGTHTGWNLRHPDSGAPEQLQSMQGSTHWFAATPEQRRARNDARPSLAERYAGPGRLPRRRFRRQRRRWRTRAISWPRMSGRWWLPAWSATTTPWRQRVRDWRRGRSIVDPAGRKISRAGRISARPARAGTAAPPNPPAHKRAWAPQSPHTARPSTIAWSYSSQFGCSSPAAVR